jgi:mono/diheme cytochrome c family protein
MNSHRSESGRAGVRVVLALLLVALPIATYALGTTVANRNGRSHAETLARGKQISYSSGCIDCHTPDTTRMLSGSELGWEGPWGVSYPRNLTPDMETGIGSWTEQDIVDAVRLGHRPDQTMLLPPMPWPAYSQMSDDDVWALAAYIKSLPPVKHKVPDVIPPDQPAVGARITFPPPPEWDGRNLPKPPADGPVAGGH